MIKFMTAGLKTIAIVSLVVLSVLGSLWILGIIPQAEFESVAGKAVAVF